MSNSDWSECFRSICFCRLVLLMRTLHIGHLFLITGRTRILPVPVGDGPSVIPEAVTSVLVVDGVCMIAGTVPVVLVIDGAFMIVGAVTAVLVLDSIFVDDSESSLCLQTSKWFLKSPLLRIVVEQNIQWKWSDALQPSPHL